MEMVNKGGMSFWVPVADHENAVINSYARWEQAFRVFSNIYTRHHGWASELLQYSHTIFTAAQTFCWDNVYRYDREFRVHMSRHHPNRSWSVILQQAWSMCLKDKNSNGSYHGFGHNNMGHGRGQGQGQQSSQGVRRWLCFDYNQGNCTFGRKCKFDHRCAFCNKFGHGAHNCRRSQNKGSGNNQGQGHHHQGQGHHDNHHDRRTDNFNQEKKK